MNRILKVGPFQIKQKRYQSFLLCVAVFFLFADQNLMAPNLSAIAKEFGFNDAQKNQKLGGDIALGFFLVGGVAALFVGYLTDTVSRFLLFGIVVICGEMASIATYCVENYWQLFFYRTITGISIGGATPIVFSLLGDMYKQSNRIYASSLIGVAISGGTAGGQLMAGLVGPAYGWRLPFLIVAIPALLCAMLVVFTTVEPSRGGQEKEFLILQQHRKVVSTVSYQQDEGLQGEVGIGEEGVGRLGAEYADEGEYKTTGCARFEGSESILSVPNPLTSSTVSTSESSKALFKSDEQPEEDVHYAEKIEWQKVLLVLSTPSCIIIFVQGLPGCLPWGMALVFLNDFFSNEGGFSVQAATALLTLFAIGGIFGQLAGGWAGQRLYNREPRLQCVLMGLSTLSAVPLMIFLLTVQNAGKAEGGSTLFSCVAFLTGMLIFINGPNVRVVLQNVCMPEVRGTAFAIFTLTDDIGKGLGPALVVLFIKACNGSRRMAFQIVVLFWIFCGCMLLSLTATVKEDERLVQVRIREALQASSGKQQQARDRSRSNSGSIVSNSDSIAAAGATSLFYPNPTGSTPSVVKYNTAETVRMTLLPRRDKSPEAYGEIIERELHQPDSIRFNVGQDVHGPPYQAFKLEN